MQYEINMPVIKTTEEKSAWFQTIYEMSKDLAPEETLTVFEFGKKGDCLLEIIKDTDYNPKTGSDNIIRIWTVQKGESGIMEDVDKSDYILIPENKDYLFTELARIWEGEDLGID